MKTKKIRAFLMIAIVAGVVLGEKPDIVKAQNNKDMETLPIYSSEYLMEYIDSHQIKLPKVKKKKTIQKAMQSRLEPVFLKKVNDSGKYAVTNEETELLYVGKVKDNKPDGIGKITKLLSSEEYQSDNGIKVEFDSYKNAEDSSQICGVLVYMGEFRDGYYDGYGWEYITPFTNSDDLLNSIYRRSLGDNYVAVSSSVQENILATCNPVKYMGEYKKGKYNGDGIEIFYPIMEVPVGQEEAISSYMNGDVEREIVIYQGEYKKGKANGRIKEYLYGILNFEGEMEKGKRNGNGVLYYQNSEQKKYDGEWRADKYDGEGTLYDETGQVIYSGEWDYGDYEY